VTVDVDGVAIRGTWYRHIPHRGKLGHRPDPAPDGRWQHGAVVEGFYLADSEATAWAEWYRQLAEYGIPPMRQMPRNLWRWTVNLRVANLRTPARLSRVGLVPPPPARASWPRYQEVGDALFADGWAGLVAPSAARPAGRVLCLFRTAATVNGAKAVPPPTVYRYPPSPPAGMTT
jgi:RES domain-containing protein